MPKETLGRSAHGRFSRVRPSSDHTDRAGRRMTALTVPLRCLAAVDRCNRSRNSAAAGSSRHFSVAAHCSVRSTRPCPRSARGRNPAIPLVIGYRTCDRFLRETALSGDVSCVEQRDRCKVPGQTDDRRRPRSKKDRALMRTGLTTEQGGPMSLPMRRSAAMVFTAAGRRHG